ncbi:MAG: hypothetical protein H6736_24030 [Alphaproteobacteria bacterium]|nr:hypothetical protein [Alphaproteobacteria bacterium]MCB9694890.1 hypothetical protein [Alphaproteobacteria bacterium]
MLLVALALAAPTPSLRRPPGLEIGAGSAFFLAPVNRRPGTPITRESVAHAMVHLDLPGPLFLGLQGIHQTVAGTYISNVDRFELRAGVRIPREGFDVDVAAGLVYARWGWDYTTLQMVWPPLPPEYAPEHRFAGVLTVAPSFALTAALRLRLEGRLPPPTRRDLDSSGWFGRGARSVAGAGLLVGLTFRP